MTDSAYSRFGAKLIAMGYCAVPAVPGTKVPGMFVGGSWRRMADWTRRYKDRLPSDREVDTWEKAAAGGICLIMGKASRGVVAVDIDTDESVPLVCASLPATPARKRGQKGETLFYRNPHGIASKSFTLIHPDGRRQRLVDVLCEGRQTVVPPTIHPDTGKPYYWSGESDLTEIEPEDLPELPADALDRIADALRPLGYATDMDRAPIQSKAAVSSDNEKSPFRVLNEFALANLDLWVPTLPLCRLRRTSTGYEAVPDWRPSNRGRPLNARKLNLKLSPSGIVDFGDGPKGYTAIDLVVACGLAPDAERAFGWLSDATGWTPAILHMPKPRQIIAQGDLIADAETGEVIEYGKIPHSEPAPPAAAPTSSIPPWKAPIDPTRCPGLVGRIADWIVATADYQQPLLAIGAALTIVGTVAGRQLAGPTKSGTHLYTIGVAPTGSGKDHPTKAINRVLHAARCPHMIGPGDFTSQTSITNAVLRSPASLCVMDEFGAFLARGKSRMASTHEQTISAILRKLYTSSFDIVSLTERAGERFKLIYSPALSIFGTSTAEEFYDALGEGDTRNGLLNRFLILENAKRPQRVKAAQDRNEVPADISDDLYSVYYRLGELGASAYHGQGDSPCADPIVVPWGDAGAERVYDDLVNDLQTRMDAEPDNVKYLVRTAEMAVRIATIRAIGIDWRDPRVTQTDMLWGAAVALASAQTMIEGAQDRIAESERQRWANRLLDAIKRHSPATMRDIKRSVKQNIRPNDLKDILADLSESGRIELIDVTDKRSDTKKRTAYRYIEGGHQ